MRILSFRRTLLVLAALVAAEAAVILAHGPTPQGNQAAPPPSFVTLDFRAVRDDGTPITDLQIQDVTLKIDGRPRELASLDVVQLDSRQGDPTIPPLPLGFTSNTSTGREFMIVFDDESISAGNERVVREAAAKLIASLWPADRVGLVTPKGNINIGLTNLHDRVATAFATVVGHASASETAADAACRTRQTLDVIKSVMASFSVDVPGTIVLLSGGMTPPGRNTTTPSAGGRTGSSSSTASACEIRREDYEDIADTAGQASVDLRVFYIINDLSSGKAGTTDMQAGLESLAGATGEALGRLGPDIGPRLVKETGAYYRVAFQPEAGEQNNQGHRVEILLGRKGAILRAPQRVYIAKPGKASTPKTPNVGELVAGGAALRGVGLRMSTVVRGATEKGVTTMVIVEPIDPGTKLSAASVGFVDSKGQLKRANTPAAELARFPVVTTLVLAPGYYRARVAVADSTGALGAVSEDVRAELVPAGDLKISGLLFGTLEKGSFEPRLHFSNEEAAVGYMEFNNVPKGAEVTANLELTLSVDDPAKVAFPMQIKNGANDTQKIAIGALPIKAFPVGEFLVRAVVNVGGKPAGRAFRTIVKSR
jgi:hypothetical protein